MASSPAATSGSMISSRAGHSRMRQRREAVGGVDDLDDVRRRRTRARHERGHAGGEKAIERLLQRLHVAGLEQRACQQRPSDRAARPGRRVFEDALDLDRCAQRREPRADLAQPRHAKRALLLQERRQRLVIDVDEVAQDVDVAFLVDRRDLDARNQPKSGGRRRLTPPRRGPATVS